MSIKDDYFIRYNEILSPEVIKDAAEKLLMLNKDKDKMVKSITEVNDIDKNNPVLSKIDKSSRELVDISLGMHLKVISSNKLLTLIILRLDLAALGLLTSVVKITDNPERALTHLMQSNIMKLRKDK